jgi:6-pyruvoyltetrahydropterin/6-carboxytetrahydropterin synthase
MPVVEITRRLEFDAGHRIPDHKSKCRNAHGHRYVLEATIEGSVQEQIGRSDTGMVLDFGDLKTVMNDEVAEAWDHAFLVYDQDLLMIQALGLLGPSHKTICLPFVPTVENLAHEAFNLIDKSLRTTGNQFSLQRLRLYETPNCYCDVSAPKGGINDTNRDRATEGHRTLV